MNIEERIKKEFDIKKYLYVKDVIPKEICYFLTSMLLLESRKNNKGDEQVADAAAVVHHEPVFSTLLELVWPMLEETIGEKLLPTYAYSRLYKNGNDLKKHTDRPACEISVTLQLGRSHHYSWPIFMGGNRIDLAEGDGVIYKGCEIDHWREKCSGPNNYYSGQVFLHYVKENGIYKNEAYDRMDKIKYVKNSHILMLQK